LKLLIHYSVATGQKLST